MKRKKSVSLAFRGFGCTAQHAASLMSIVPVRLGNRGELVLPHVKTLLNRSYVQYSMTFQIEFPLSDMLGEFSTYAGGVDHLCHVQSQIQSEFLDLHVDLPVKHSRAPQEGCFSEKDIVDICRLKTGISLGFF